jgi:calcineurin-like phosphoesterase family protein
MVHCRHSLGYFGHTNIIKYCGRPYKTAHDMDESMIKDWNDTVGKNDWVIHLGDFSFQSDHYVHKLNGKIILVKGNHDSNKYNGLFEAVVENLPVKIGEFNCYLIHTPIDPTAQYKKGREPDFSILNRYDFVICGHVHEKWRVSGKNINVGIDIWKKPIHIDELKKYLRSLRA